MVPIRKIINGAVRENFVHWAQMNSGNGVQNQFRTADPLLLFSCHLIWPFARSGEIVQEAGADKVWAVQGGDVLRREAHVEALVGTRERVRGAARAAQEVDSSWPGSNSSFARSLVSQ